MKKRNGKFTREIDFRPAWDKRHSDPGKNYGIHGVEIAFYFTGNRGAIQFILYTNWQLPHVEKEQEDKPINPRFPHLYCKPVPSDLGYHSPKPMYKDQPRMSGECHLMKGDCYYDGSTLNAREPFDILITKGEEALWGFLGEYYGHRFGETK